MSTPFLLDCSSSPYSQLKPVPINSVSLQDGFLADLLQTIRQITLPTQFDMLECTGRLDNFRRVDTSKNISFKGYFYNDSDVYKWLEGACWIMATGCNELLSTRIDEVIELIIAAQDQDGYINTYFLGENSGSRWSNLRDMHELYCAGHLIQAAIAHHRVTEQDKLLVVAVNLADHICRRFLDTELPATSGHPEIEMALVELYRTVGEVKYLRMAQSFLDQRGIGLLDGREYHIDHMPFRKMKRLVGHAVRALYLCCGATDIFLETGENLLLETVEGLWERMVNSQMYVTGGVGSRYQGESFGNDYELPNERAYAETCAAIGSLMWNWRMLHTSKDVKYADLIEWTLFNAVLPGIGINGKEYHYVNPLAVMENHTRQAWFDCACCPPNIFRILSSIGGYLFSYTENTIWIHQYTSSQFNLQLSDDHVIKFSLETDLPWSGEVEINYLSAESSYPEDDGRQLLNLPISFGLNLRIPSWVDDEVTIFINDKPWHRSGKPGSYIMIDRMWIVGDKINLKFPLRTHFLSCHPFVFENSNRVAVSRGPLLYCIEGCDNLNIDPREVRIQVDGNTTIQPVEISSLEIPTIEMDGMINPIDVNWRNHLYLESPMDRSIRGGNKHKVIAIPYFLWGNREQSWMQVWLSC